MLRSLKMHGMAQAVEDLAQQGAPAFEAAVPMLSQFFYLNELHADAFDLGRVAGIRADGGEAGRR